MGLFFISCNNQEKIEFELFLGKHVGQIRMYFNGLERLRNANQFYSRVKDHKYFGQPYFGISVSVDDQDIVEEIKIHFTGHIDKPFYEVFSQRYGEATYIGGLKKEDATELESMEKTSSRKQVVSTEAIESDLTSAILAPFFGFIETNFEDAPQLILWNKNNYQISILLVPFKDITEVKFSKPKD